MKLRIKFEKAEPVKYISHLDMMRAFERAFRRAKLPLAYSKGFTPHPRLIFSPALSVGVTSSSEYVDVEFYEDIPVQEVLRRLNSCLPEGLKALKASDFEGKFALSEINAALYAVSLAGDYPKEYIEAAVKELVNKKEINMEKVTKKGIKKVNIAPMIYNIKVMTKTGGGILLKMTIAAGQRESVSPDMIIKALSIHLSEELIVKHIHREELYLIKEGNSTPPL
ncbi:MAG: hypothetical protein PWQ97_137 [Tepidanaerobacteraceae bacterium]|nr:hypothetical protein [Tepidanaerobacteraceae bacterium]